MTVNVWVAVAPVESVTLTVNVNVPASVGVPLMIPVEDKARPGGSDPDTTDQVLGGVPPNALTSAE